MVRFGFNFSLMILVLHGLRVHKQFGLVIIYIKRFGFGSILFLCLETEPNRNQIMPIATHNLIYQVQSTYHQDKLLFLYNYIFIIILMAYVYFHTWELKWTRWLSCITCNTCAPNGDHALHACHAPSHKSMIFDTTSQWMMTTSPFVVVHLVSNFSPNNELSSPFYRIQEPLIQKKSPSFHFLFYFSMHHTFFPCTCS